MEHIMYIYFCVTFPPPEYIFSRQISLRWSHGLLKIWVSANQISELHVQNLFHLLYDTSFTKVTHVGQTTKAEKMDQFRFRILNLKKKYKQSNLF